MQNHFANAQAFGIIGCVRQFLKIILPVVSMFACAAQAAEGPGLVADTLSYDINTHVQTASGNAVLVHEGTTLEADQILFNESTRIAHAIGHVKVTRASLRLVTDDLSYNLTEKSFKCTDFRAGYPPMFLEGSAASGTAQHIELSNVVAYMGEPESASPTISAESMVLNADKRVLAVGTKPGIGGVKLFRIPRIAGKLTELPKASVKVDAGYSDNLGLYAAADVQLPVSKSLAAGANVEQYTKRGTLVGPTASYDFSGTNTEMTGSLSTGWIKDFGDPQYDYFTNKVPENRWFIQERHKQVINDTVYVTSYVNLMSDTEMMRDFRQDFFDNNQYPDNYVEVSAPIGEDLMFSALTRFTAGGNDYATIQRLPEVRLDYLTNPLPFGGLYQTGFVMAAATDYTVDGHHFRNQREHAYYGISRPTSIAPWLSFMPKIGGFAGHYDKAWNYDDGSMTDLNGATHYIGELGADLVASFNAQWEFKSERWNINGLRHIVRPVAYWRHYGSAGDDNWITKDIDFGVSQIQMPSIDLRDIESNDTDYLFNQNFVRSGVENILQTRSGETSRELASLNLYHDSNFENHDLDIDFMQLSLAPSDFIKFSFENGYDLSEMKGKWYRARTILKSADRWSLQLCADYYKNNYESYYTSYFYQLTRNWGANIRVGYDAQENEFDRLSLSVLQDVGSFWKISYRIRYKKDDLWRDDLGFSVSITSKKF